MFYHSNTIIFNFENIFIQVLKIIQHFEKSKKRILMIGRVHMNWWSKETMAAIQKKADVFLTKNL